METNRSRPGPTGDDVTRDDATTWVVVTGGDPPDGAVVTHLPCRAKVLGVDRGVAHARDLGLHVSIAVGDFDSLDEATLADARADGAEVQCHPRAKDATDLELGLVAAEAAGARRIVVVGGDGGRLDHLLANALLLAGDRFARLTLEARLGPAWVAVVRPGSTTTVRGRVGGTVSLLPVGGPACAVATTGLAYPLDGEDLPAGTTRGVSNELVDGTATVAIGGGTLLVVAPGEVET